MFCGRGRTVGAQEVAPEATCTTERTT